MVPARAWAKDFYLQLSIVLPLSFFFAFWVCLFSSLSRYLIFVFYRYFHLDEEYRWSVGSVRPSFRTTVTPARIVVLRLLIHKLHSLASANEGNAAWSDIILNNSAGCTLDVHILVKRGCAELESQRRAISSSLSRNLGSQTTQAAAGLGSGGGDQQP